MRRTSADWFNKKQVRRGRLVKGSYSLILPISPTKRKINGTVSTRSNCAVEGIEGVIMTTSTNFSLETRGEEPVQINSTRSKCAAEVTRVRISDYY